MCQVYEDLSLKEEAGKYLYLNKERKQPRAVDDYKVSLVAGDQTILVIQSILEQFEVKDDMDKLIVVKVAKTKIQAFQQCLYQYYNQGEKKVIYYFQIDESIDEYSGICIEYKAEDNEKICKRCAGTKELLEFYTISDRGYT